MSIIQASELFIFGFDGLSLSSQLDRFLGSQKVGGAILFKRNIETVDQLVALNKQIIESNKEHPPLLSVDQEGGRVARLRGITSDLPCMASFKEACIKKPELMYRIGAMMGRELVALGFNLNFAPVCDIAIGQEEHDIIGDRAFSDNAEEVASLSAIFIKGMQGAGLAASAKHFPGHGATRLDSHFALPTVMTSTKIMRTRELLPFRSAIDAQVATIMTAHIIATSYDSALPATLSKILIRDLLRAEMGYDGVVISDDLDMKAVADHYDLKEILENGLMASVDMFIIGNNFAKTSEAIAILQELIDNNEHIKKHAALAIARIKQMRGRFLGAPAAPDLKQVKALLKSPPHLELIRACR